jgi:hypothetical protein
MDAAKLGELRELARVGAETGKLMEETYEGHSKPEELVNIVPHLFAAQGRICHLLGHVFEELYEIQHPETEPAAERDEFDEFIDSQNARNRAEQA